MTIKDAPVKWLRGQIARYLEAHPDFIMAVEEALKACYKTPKGRINESNS